MKRPMEFVAGAPGLRVKTIHVLREQGGVLGRGEPVERVMRGVRGGVCRKHPCALERVPGLFGMRVQRFWKRESLDFRTVPDAAFSAERRNAARDGDTGPGQDERVPARLKYLFYA